MKTEASDILSKYPTNREYPTYYHFKDVLEAMHEFVALSTPKWVSVDTPPTDSDRNVWCGTETDVYLTAFQYGLISKDRGYGFTNYDWPFGCIHITRWMEIPV